MKIARQMQVSTGTIDISNATTATTNIIDGSNTITFNTLPTGEYGNITIRVIDSAVISLQRSMKPKGIVH